MNQKEKLLAEAVKSMFNNDPSVLGIIKGRPSPDPTARMPHQYEYIMDVFSMKILDSLHFESIKSAFYDIHSYKFINDPTFKESFERRMKAIGVPFAEIEKANKAIAETIKEISGNDIDKNIWGWDERSAGWHPDLDGIRQVSQDFNQKRKQEQPYSGGGPAPSKTSLTEAYEIFNQSSKLLPKVVLKEAADYASPGEQVFIDRFGTTPSRRLVAIAGKLLSGQGGKEFTEMDITRALANASTFLHRVVANEIRKLDREKAALVSKFFTQDMNHFVPGGKPSRDLINATAISLPEMVTGARFIQKSYKDPELALNVPSPKLPERENPQLGM